ncbi:MAG: hypothetical protein AAFP20_17690 [Cyanobacteria bacterium J06614_10]
MPQNGKAPHPLQADIVDTIWQQLRQVNAMALAKLLPGDSGSALEWSAKRIAGKKSHSMHGVRG